MATTTVNLVNRINNTAELNALYGGISSAVVAVGCTRVGGSVTWGAVAQNPSSVYTYGYEVFKLPTGPAGSSEVYFKFTYKSGAAGSIPQIAVEQGTGWNSGTGALTGTGSAIAPKNLWQGNLTDTTARPCIFSCDDDGIIIAFYWNSPTTASRWLLLIDRQRNPSGTADPVSGWPSPTGFCRFWTIGVANHDCLLVDPGANEAVQLGKWPAVTRGDLTATKSMLTTVAPAGVMPTYPTWPATRQGTYASKLFMTYSLQDCPAGTDLVIDHLGAPRHYYTLSSQFTQVDHLLSAGAAAAIWTSD